MNYGQDGSHTHCFDTEKEKDHLKCCLCMKSKPKGHEVVIGDGEYEKKEVLDLREVHYGGKDMRWFIRDTEFDGHHTLWGFEFFPTTYLKRSGLSGDEYRKGGEIRYYKDRKQCYSEFCRDPKIAALKIGETLLKLMDFPWENVTLGRKVFFDQTPAIVDMIIEEQGCVVLRTEDGKDFPNLVWCNKEDGSFDEREECVKVEIISPSIWWYRK